MAINRKTLIVLCLVCLAWPMAAFADVVVIVHPDNPRQTITEREVSDIYLGRTRSIAAYDLPMDHPLREIFFQSLNGLSIRQINAYWARLRFSGEILPPTALPDVRTVVEAVSRNRNAIGYADGGAVNASVKVILRLKE
jgi:ABC-type phosphate transport system substrate-binding protein